MKDPIAFARRFCRFAGWYGILGLIPLLFMETKFGSHYPPPVSHPEFYFGFISIALSWHVAFLILSRNPLAHRTFLIPAGLEKLAFASSCIALFTFGKAPSFVALFGGIDLCFAGGFFYAFWKLSALTM